MVQDRNLKRRPLEAANQLKRTIGIARERRHFAAACKVTQNGRALANDAETGFECVAAGDSEGRQFTKAVSEQ